jgi:ATP synthase protein I
LRRAVQTGRKKLFNYRENRAWAENLAIVMQIGLTMAGCITFCFFLGWSLDRWLGTRGIFVTIFILFGVIGGGYIVYREVNKLMSQGKSEDTKESNNGTP